MPATRKIQPEASSQDLNQLKSLFGAKEEKIETVALTENKPDEKIETVAPKKENKDKTIGIRMTEEKNREFKAYFIQHGMTMADGVIGQFELVKELEEKGIVKCRNGQWKIVKARVE